MAGFQENVEEVIKIESTDLLGDDLEKPFYLTKK
jgi:hypothetical protein